MKAITCTAILFLFTTPLVAQLNVADSGKQSFLFSEFGFTKQKPLKVWYYSPSKKQDSLPVVIMLHGSKRNPSAYLDDWIPTARLFNCIVVAPEFSQKDYPKADKYNLANVYNSKTKTFNPSSEWAFSLIEPLFDHIKKQTGNINTGYYLSGHSAGSQFVHRFLFFNPDNRVIKAMASNAGWYTLPDDDITFPYGLKNSPVKKENLQKVFNKKVFIILGESDTDTTREDFSKGPDFDAYGKNRYERGLYFFEACKKKARQLKTDFNWQLATVPGVAHSNKDISRFAAALLFMELKN